MFSKELQEKLVRIAMEEAEKAIQRGDDPFGGLIVDREGNIVDFSMNDKCAAGTGRFLEMMANTLGMELPEFACAGLKWEEDIHISSMCSVFAESEVVSLVAQNKKKPE